jgi:hypothetical protein
MDEWYLIKRALRKVKEAYLRASHFRKQNKHAWRSIVLRFIPSA